MSEVHMYGAVARTPAGGRVVLVSCLHSVVLVPCFRARHEKKCTGTVDVPKCLDTLYRLEPGKRREKHGGSTKMLSMRRSDVTRRV